MRLMMFLVILALIGTACNTGEGAEALRKGGQLLSSPDPADWEKAIPFFEDSIRIEYQARRQIARTHLKSARHKINQAGITESDPEATLLRHEGAVAVELGLLEQGISNLQAALAITPADRTIHYFLGIAYGQLSRATHERTAAQVLLEKARAAYQAALRIDGDYHNARYGLAIIELSRQDHDTAIRLLLELVNAEPKEPRAYFALARAYYDKEQYANSLNIYRMLLEILPPRSEKRETVRLNMRRLETLLNR